MEYKQALEQIGEKYKVIEKAYDMAQIIVEKDLDSFNLYYIAIIKDGDKLYLNDLANTCEVIDMEEEKFASICQEHKLEFDNWHIGCEYKSLDDLENFIACLDDIVEKSKKVFR